MATMILHPWDLFPVTGDQITHTTLWQCEHAQVGAIRESVGSSRPTWMEMASRKSEVGALNMVRREDKQQLLMMSKMVMEAEKWEYSHHTCPSCTRQMSDPVLILLNLHQTVQPQHASIALPHEASVAQPHEASVAQPHDASVAQPQHASIAQPQDASVA